MFSCDFCEIFKNTVFTEQLWTTASLNLKRISRSIEIRDEYFRNICEGRSGHQRSSMKKVFLKVWQNSQENTCARVSFLIKLQAWGLQLYLKKRLWPRCFAVNFVKFFRTPFLQNTSGRMLLWIICLLICKLSACRYPRIWIPLQKARKNCPWILSL